MKTSGLFLLAAVLCPAAAAAQGIVVSQPADHVILRAADDFATRAFQDPWDMNQKTDIGPLLGSADQPASGFTNIAFSGGLFFGTTTAGDANLWLLDTGNPNAAPIGKIGTNHPVDASAFKILAVRARVQRTAQMLVNHWADTIYTSGAETVGSGVTLPGWNIATVNLGADSSWTGMRRAVRFSPAAGMVAEDVHVDWARLVSFDPSLCRPITWTGAGFADIYLDNDTNPDNGHLGVIQPFASTSGGSASRASGGCPVIANAYNFYVGVLPAGSYHVLVAPLNVTPTVSNAGYAQGSWTINDSPILVFTSPNEEGSEDDFATTQLGNAWDMDALSDFDFIGNVNSPQISRLNLEAADGTVLPNQRVLFGTNVSGSTPCSGDGDPVLVPLKSDVRGRNVSIDPDRYRILTVEFGIPNLARHVNCGSIARVMWRARGNGPVNGFAGLSESDDVVFTSRTGANVLDRITVDLTTLRVEQGPGAGGPNWIKGPDGGIDFLRFDPHEFTPATPFYIKRIKLTSLEQAKTTYTIRWNYSEASGTVDLYYDFDGAGFNGVPIETFIDATSGQYTWAIPPGLLQSPGRPVHIYAIVRDSTGSTGNENRVYAKLPILLDSNFVQRPRVVVSRSKLNFGITAGTTTTDAQTFRLSFVGSGAAPCWRINSSNPARFAVSPSTGIGSTTITVSLMPQTFPGVGEDSTVLTIEECTPNTILNPNQQVTAIYRIASVSTPPTGQIDTPADGVTVSGSVSVTGWAVDDIGIRSVEVWCEAGGTEFLIGNAVRVDDARPDVEDAQPDTPFNYRAGWGYMMLTNFLPGGDGTKVLRVYATDREGHRVVIGQRTIVVANSAAQEPFGAIDLPTQGQTVSGLIENHGWVLTRGPFSASPVHGGIVNVYIDNVMVGSPAGWSARADLTTLFPSATYPGITHAAGVFAFDSTAFSDGVHTIAWVVTDNNGKAAGVGSRFFTIVNDGNSAVEANASVNLGRRHGELPGMDVSSAVRVGRGYSLRDASHAVNPGASGVRTVYGRAMEPVTIDASVPGKHQYEAYLLVSGILRPIPAGASFDGRKGILAWHPGLAFNGAYDFVIVRDGATRVPIRMVLGPAATRIASSHRPGRIPFPSTF